MKWNNSNFWHNAMNVAIALVTGGALTGFDWTAFGMTDHTALKISGGLALLKLVINAVRDGPTGMVAPPPPAEEK